MYIIAINNGLIFYPENEYDILFIKGKYDALPVLNGLGWIPKILIPYYSSYQNSPPVANNSYNYFFSELKKQNLGYDPTNLILSTSIFALTDGYYVQERGIDGSYKEIVSLNVNDAILQKNIPQHPNIVNICDFASKDYEQIIKNYEKQIAFLDKLVATDLVNLVSDLAIIKTALATPCVNGSPLNPTFTPAFTNSSQTDYNNYKTEINNYQQNILGKAKDFFANLMTKIKGE
jgi:hypothetical protein